MGIPRKGIIGFVCVFEFIAAIKKHNELTWILQCDEKSNEMKDFLKLVNKIQKIYTDNISIDKAVELFPNHQFNTAFPWGYTNEIVCIILTEFKYKPCNQYYYSQMDDERLKQMVDWAYKEYRKKCLINDISQDFN